MSSSDDDRSSRAGVMICGERVGGMQAGRGAALLDWRHRKEARDFAVLVNRLRARKWRIENPDRYRAKQRECARRPAARAKQAAWKAKRRAARLRSTIYTCAHCGSTWCGVPWVQPRKQTRFCSDRCAKASRRAGARERSELAQRTCSECGVSFFGRRQDCSDACKLRRRYHEKNPGARRISRKSGRGSA
jgi:hypothetical protein